VQVQRPGDMFDREEEWDTLVRFATSRSPHALLGIVSGRRRQGKSYLLQALCEQADGVYLSAAELTGREALLALGAALGASRGLPPLLLTDWPSALDAVLALSADHPLPVVIDEFPYLAKAVPELPSHLQTALGPRRPQRRGSRVRLVLCGSALSFMGRLLSGTAPLRGRATLDMVVRPFDYRAAARFWGLDDPALALRVHAIVGGTPAYRREFVDDDAPASMNDFDGWVTRTVLNPRSPLFREARYLLAEETDLRDTTGYHALLAAVTAGNATRARIGSALGRTGTEISHQLTVLEDAGLLVRREDAFRRQRPTYAVAEPLLAFYEAVMRPQWPRLERGHGAAVWAESRSRFAAQVLGPHFESLCREWAAYHAAPETLGGVPARVDAGVVSDPVGRATHEVDVVALDASERVLALGEAKLGEVMGIGHVERLRRVRELLGRRADAARLLCFSGAGFAADLRAAARRGEVELVDLTRLYGGA
jgi:AAA+ ATPase superfamily predicted ATPase